MFFSVMYDTVHLLNKLQLTSYYCSLLILIFSLIASTLCIHNMFLTVLQCSVAAVFAFPVIGHHLSFPADCG